MLGATSTEPLARGTRFMQVPGNSCLRPATLPLWNSVTLPSHSPSMSERTLPAPAQPSFRLPYLALALFLGAIASLVWLTRTYDREEQHTTLLHDALWIEQSLQFKLAANAELLGQLGPDLLAGRPLGERDHARLRQLLQPDNGIVRVLWLDAQGQLRGSQPSEGSLPPPELSRLAQALGAPVYGPPHVAPGGDHHFAVHVPVFAGSTPHGSIVGVYSTRQLINQHLPWWFAERYRAVIMDADGREIAAKSQVAPLADEPPYSIPFDPPGHGLTLQISPYRQQTRWILVLLIASMVLLGCVILWSLWQLRRHIQRRLAAEKALRTESAFRKAMEDSLTTGLRARDLDGRITYVNPAFCRMTGYRADELIGHTPPLPYWDPDHLPLSEDFHRQLLEGRGPAEGIERHFVRRDGSALDVLLFEAPLIDAEGRHAGWMGSVLDITEQKRMREHAAQQAERLQATSRLITMGEMASTLAHELNQPLAAIKTYNTGCLNLLERPAPQLGELREIHEKLGRQAERAAQIIRRVHDFVRRHDPKREQVEIDGLVREAIALLEPDARKRGVRIELQQSGVLPPLAADPVMIQQVLVNLMRNGMDAMQETPAARRCLEIGTDLADGMASIRIRDHGCGIPPEIAQRLFEPFFTTRPEGMGMGLNICRSIAELHHGRLAFEAAASGGTIFIFSLPVTPP